MAMGEKRNQNTTSRNQYKLKRILITSAGGPASENVVKNLLLADKNIYTVGCDIDSYMLQLSSVDKKYVVHSAYDAKNYIKDLNAIIEKEKITMLYPQSDIEVITCAANRQYLKAPLCLPSLKVITMCQDKGFLYAYLKSKGIAVPEFKLPTHEDIRKLCFESPNYGVGVGWNYPYWIRARTGAGGKDAFLAKSWREFKAMMQYRGGIGDWMIVKYLAGDDYSWTGIFKEGKLLTSVLKKRLKWVYNRIGTTAVQETMWNLEINEYCYSIVKALDPKLTGIMMIDLKQDKEDGKVYVTEVNAGRVGTVNLFYGLASQKIYKDNRVNFPYILTRISYNQPLPKGMIRYNALPEHLIYIRHIDMSSKILTRDELGVNE
jgi:glutathione synthase/RimK-type ligase-like ATP-grasp enzyme